METHQKEPVLLVVGAGHAGSELAIAARQNGWPGAIVLLGEEASLPYQRPPLSKAWLAGEVDSASLALRPQAAYDAADISLRLGARMVGIDREVHEIELAGNERLRYARLALCTGGRPRALACPGMDPAAPPRNLFYLRTQADAEGIRQALHPGARLVIIGAGYVGLEVAASARKLGAQVTVLEAQARVLARVAGESVSRFYQALHESHGVRFLTGTTAEGIDVDAGHITGVRLPGDRHLPADVVVAGLGMLPNIEVAQAAGLADAQGIRIDACGVTDDADIVAAGDCTAQHHAIYGRTMRLESVPNALEQARTAAAAVCGLRKPQASVPWFWSDQYDLKLQLAGLSQGHDQCVLRGDPDKHSFAAFYLKQGRLIAVDAVNRPMEFMLARRVLAQQPCVDATRLVDESIPLKEQLVPAQPILTGKS